MELDKHGQDEVDKQTKIEDLIVELCLSSPSEAVKFCLRTYQYGRSLMQLEKDFSKQKRDVLRETAGYLNIPGFMDKTKEPLAHLIICRIQNLLPDDCGICNSRYRICNSEKPILECSICGQGVHTECWIKTAKSSLSDNSDRTTQNDNLDSDSFKKMYNPLNLAGLFYICKACQPNVIPSDEEGNYKRNRKKNVSRNADARRGSQSGADTQVPTSWGSQASVNNEEETLAIQTGPAASESVITDVNATHAKTPVLKSVTNADAKAEAKIPPSSQNISTHDTDSEENNSETCAKSDKICLFFRNGNCKHGISGKECKFAHPKVCAKFKQHGTKQPRGCKQGKKCKDFHPKMCFDSLRKGECFKEQCHFNHIKGTKRAPPVEKNQIQSTAVKSAMKADKKPKSNPTKDKVTFASPYEPKDMQGINGNTADNFLGMMCLLKSELMQILEEKMSSITAQINQIQQAQTHTYPQKLPAMAQKMFPTYLPLMYQPYQQQ